MHLSKSSKDQRQSMYVLDPAGRDTGVYGISLPWTSILETRAVHQSLNYQKPPSLCMLFQNGHCRMGSQCQQVHVPPKVVSEIREQCTALGTCCLEHGDSHSIAPTCPIHRFIRTFPTIKMAIKNASPVLLPLAHFGWTTCLEKLLRHVKSKGPSFAKAQVCRLHQKRLCSYGQECRHIHVCRTQWQALLEKYPQLDQNSPQKQTSPSQGEPKSAKHSGFDTPTKLTRPSQLKSTPNTALRCFARRFAGSPVDNSPDDSPTAPEDLPTLLDDVFRIAAEGGQDEQESLPKNCCAATRSPTHPC
eukprot:NODE_3217_length_1009_cov_4.597506_g3071_i0.p1 GENE.NODE_3217_length_1009_cov_4.597506_g3071_i0~~NODE_3217_length_1009_cov_4.597506_g3071_i0.p1  ORF type:complete len:313 (-),score=49.21 NODE_3217_length_1009_cov_4.597506_g3071_i0:71-979(-)